MALEIKAATDASRDRTWRLQLVGLALLGIIFVAALLGFFGSGPMAIAEVRSGSLQLEYPRYLRATVPVDLRFTALPARGSGGKLKIRLPSAYLENFELLSAVPEPERMQDEAGMIAFDLNGREGQPFVFLLTLRAKQTSAGRVQGEASSGGETVRFRQMIWP